MTNLQIIGWFVVLVFVLVGGHLCWSTAPVAATASPSQAHLPAHRAGPAGEQVERVFGVEARVLLFVFGTLLMGLAGTALSYVYIRRRYAPPRRFR